MVTETQEFDSRGRIRARVKQAFLAQAVADAFCYTYEFRQPLASEVTEDYFGTKPISISDDTQMAMFGLYALGKIRGEPFNPFSTVKVLREAYVSWYRTQTNGAITSWIPWLENEPKMRRPRAPGRTCMSSCRALALGEDVHNDSKGNGAVMRSLPFVFAPDLLNCTLDEATNLARAAGTLTHKHADSDRAVHEYMLNAWQLRKFGFPSPIDPDDKEVRGNTFTALPALRVAMFGLTEALQDGMHDERFCRMLTHFAVANIDSDTVAAIAGGLYGLMNPAPAHLIARLTERDIIEKLVDSACQ